MIIATHILATIFATGALTLHHDESGTAPTANVQSNPVKATEPQTTNRPTAVPDQAALTTKELLPDDSISHALIHVLLGIELVLLLSGFGVHQYLHHSKAVRIWANARVVAELARSIQAIHPRHVYLEHVFRLPLPNRFRALLRTLNVLHLASTYLGRNQPWEPLRDDYLVKRIEHQIEFYKKSLSIDEPRLRLYQSLFAVCSVLAMLATLTKLLVLIVASATESETGIWPQMLGTLAIVLPVLAVAGLSWAAALDCEARVETFRETLNFLERQRQTLRLADTATQYDQMLLESETVLLGEVSSWFSRRANTGVA